MTGRLCLAITAGVFLMTPLIAPAQPAPTAPPLRPFTVSGDAILSPLSDMPGDAVRGRAIVATRQTSLCLLCHTGPIPEERFQGNLAPDLAGAGSRWSEGQLRLRLADARRLNPESIMPSYYRAEQLTRVAPAWQGQPIMSGQQIEDVLAYLQTLK
ncbi:MAG: soxX [Polaromonas sp.]|nr:soxX [Polaromonas sp.]